MINQLEQENGLERQAENAGLGGVESAADREAIILAFELEEADEPGKDPVEVLKRFIQEVRDFLSRLR